MSDFQKPEKVIKHGREKKSEKLEQTKPRKVPKICTWKPKPSQILVERDGKLFLCHFDKITGIDKYAALNKFIIKKISYLNKLDDITAYTNFFMNNYDPDNELAIAYLKLKYEIDKTKHFTKDNIGALIEFIYDVMFTPTMVEKIRQMVYDNYVDDIEASTDAKKKYSKNEKKHMESLEFTNMHMKVLLRISFGMKIISPVLFHFLAKIAHKEDKDSDLIFRFYYPLFDIFGTAETYDYFDKDGAFIEDSIRDGLNEDGTDHFRKIEYSDLKDRIDSGELVVDKTTNPNNYRYIEKNGNYYEFTHINMYNKLYVYVKAKVSENNSNNAPIYGQREIFGIDKYSVINRFTKRVLISENMVKYSFSGNWNPTKKKYDENIVGFNKTIDYGREAFRNKCGNLFNCGDTLVTFSITKL